MIIGIFEYLIITIASERLITELSVSFFQTQASIRKGCVNITAYDYFLYRVSCCIVSNLEMSQCSDVSESDMDLNTLKQTSERKRKQGARDSPPSGVPVLKRQNSMPDVHSQSVKYTLAKRGAKKKTTPKKKAAAPAAAPAENQSAPFRSMLLGTFNDPTFQEGISPMISNLVSPLIGSAIQRAVESAVHEVRNEVVKPLIESNDKLLRLVEGQKSLIQTQQQRINELQADYSVVCSEMDDLQLKVNDLEQYGRRNNLRISNMFLGSSKVLTEREVTQRTVDFINQSVLKAGDGDTPITANDVDRCHTLGPIKPEGNNNIIIKFQNYHAKRAVFEMKKNLKGDSNKRFIAEDLTRLNYGLVQSLWRLRKDGRINNFWTRDGNVFAKQGENDRPSRIRTNYDIDNLVVSRPQRSSERGFARESGLRNTIR